MRILHFSDVHVQLPDWRTRSLASLGPLRKLATAELWKGRGPRYDGAEERLRQIAALAREFDHAVLTGDLTQLGTREEMALARAALEPLASDPRRFTALAGNHDRFPMNARPVQFFEEIFPEQTIALRDAREAGARGELPGFSPLRVKLLGPAGGAALLVVESAVPMSWPVMSRGAIGRASLDALARALAHPEVRARCALVLTHHSPTRAHGRLDWPVHYLHNATDFLRVAREGRAAAILAGHVHQQFDLPETPVRARVLCAGSATDAKKPTAYELHIEDGQLRDVRPLDLRRPA